MELQTYYCPWCDEHHTEAAKPNQFPILPGKCSANHRWPKDVGNWRPCHAEFEVMGGPNVMGKAHICNPCNRKLFAPALAMQKEVDAMLRTMQEGNRR